MLTTFDLIRIINHRTYRPGTLMTVHETPAQGVWFRIRGTRENAYQPGKHESFDIRSEVPDYARKDVESFDRWVVWRLGVMERHEALEWYRDLDTGKPLCDPHTEEATMPVRGPSEPISATNPPETVTDSRQAAWDALQATQRLSWHRCVLEDGGW